MAALALREDAYKGWDSWHISHGPLELVLVPQVGGRLMGLRWRGHEMLFTDPALEGQVEDVDGNDDLAARKRELGFPLWGGDKTWLAPQDRWSGGVPFLDLDSGPYELAIEQNRPDAVRLRMTSRVCRETGVQISRTVHVTAGHRGWTVVHRVINSSSAAVEWAPWGVSMLLRPARVYLPRTARSPYPDGVKTFEDEGEAAAARTRVLSELDALAVIDCRDETEFKYGVDPGEGWMLGVSEVPGPGFVGYLKQVPAYADRAYGHGCLSEVYNSHRFPYLELEVHGPLARLLPGESFELRERQQLFDLADWPASEVEVRRLL